MASAKLTKALASGNVVLQKAPRVTGEVLLQFKPLYDKETGKTVQPKPIPITLRPVDPLKRTDVSVENLRHSNLENLVRRQAVKIL